MHNDHITMIGFCLRIIMYNSSVDQPTKIMGLDHAQWLPHRTITSSDIEIDAGAIFGQIMLSTFTPTISDLFFWLG
jgi:hypothetical protein